MNEMQWINENAQKRSKILQKFCPPPNLNSTLSLLAQIKWQKWVWNKQIAQNMCNWECKMLKKQQIKKL